MKPLASLRAPTRHVGLPPERNDTQKTLDRPAGNGARRPKTGRTEEFNIRVQPGFKERFKALASREKESVGAFLEKVLVRYEASGTTLEAGMIPVAEAKAGRVAELRVWCTESVFHTIARIAAARGMLVPELIEDLVAREVDRLDPHGGKFGVDVRK